jgi:hypothetical protein
VQHGQEHRTLDRELEPTPGEQFLHHGATAAVVPQPLKPNFDTIILKAVCFQ